MLNPLIICIIIATLTVVFHVLIFLKVISYQITWGGRLKNDREMYVFETISILINIFFIGLLLIKGNYLPDVIKSSVVDISLWIFFGIFILNTVGNIFARTKLEKYFAFVTLLLAVLIYFILT